MQSQKAKRPVVPNKISFRADDDVERLLTRAKRNKGCVSLTFLINSAIREHYKHLAGKKDLAA